MIEFILMVNKQGQTRFFLLLFKYNFSKNCLVLYRFNVAGEENLGRGVDKEMFVQA